ncbi:MAG: hypothetical protein HOO06_00920 [Bdellovibrionaceae bacterium]|jgi:hypothetical protein|nr:hypothetical protein [Pseudobdellovibrionaceae bacterium]
MIRLLLICSFIYLSACGVKGPPRPPLKPSVLGRGKPHFQGATKEMAYDKIPSLDIQKTDDDEDKVNTKKKK